jgi:hypothetical protein
MDMERRLMRREFPLISVKLACAVAVLSTVANGPTADARVKLEPRISVRQTFSDNVSLDDRNKDSGFITTIAPGFALTIDGPRIQGSLNYDLNYRVGISAPVFDKFRHSAAGRINAEVLREFLFLESGIVATLLSQDPRGAISTNLDNNNPNINNIFTGFAGPYVRQRLGDVASFQGGYRFSTTLVDRNQNNAFLGSGDILDATRQLGANSQTHNLYATLSSGPAFQRFRWNASVNYEAENIRDNVQERYRSRTANLGLEYPINRYLSLLGSAGYEKTTSTILETNVTPARDPLTGQDIPGTVRSLTIGPNRIENFATDGLVWDAGFRFSPTRRTDITVRGGRRFGDTTFNVTGLKKIGKKSEVSFSYGDSLDSLGRLLTRQLGDITTSTALTGRFRTGLFPLSSIDPLTGLFSNGRLAVNSGTFRNRSASLSYTFDAQPWTANGSIYVQRRQLLRITQLPNQPPLEAGVLARNDSSFGGTLNIVKGFKAGHLLSLTGLAERNTFALNEARRDTFWSTQLAYKYRLTKKIDINASALHNQRRSTFSNANITENAVSIGLSATF